jgi:hypothetical protein
VSSQSDVEDDDELSRKSRSVLPPFPQLSRNQSAYILAQVDRIDQRRQCALEHLPVFIRQIHSGLDSYFGKSWRIDFHAASARKIEWLLLNGTDLRPLYFDNLNETFVDVSVSSNY